MTIFKKWTSSNFHETRSNIQVRNSAERDASELEHSSAAPVCWLLRWLYDTNRVCRKSTILRWTEVYITKLMRSHFNMLVSSTLGICSTITTKNCFHYCAVFPYRAWTAVKINRRRCAVGQFVIHSVNPHQLSANGCPYLWLPPIMSTGRASV